MTRAVLGIDAAWTSTQPSGIALIAEGSGGWRAIGAAPSLASFVGLARGESVDWKRRAQAGEPPLAELLGACRALLASEAARIEVVAVDMPLARGPCDARREADDAVSRRYGAAHCSTHSPTPERPGPRAAAWRDGFAELGFGLATGEHELGRSGALLEVYPHVALLTLCDATKRLPYKASRALRYWPGTSVGERVARLREVFARIAAALETQLGPLPFQLAEVAGVTTLAGLKPFEDALDALVCAWMGARFAEGRAEPLGDVDAAIWVPAER